MIITYIHRIGWFIGLVLLQVLILNSVHIAGYATPFLYIYFILKFSSGTSRNELMLWAFFFGLTIDIFSDTPGMNAAATVLLAFLRPSLLRLFTPSSVSRTFYFPFSTYVPRLSFPGTFYFSFSTYVQNSPKNYKLPNNAFQIYINAFLAGANADET